MDVSRRAQSAALCRGWAFQFAGWRDRPGGSKLWERIDVEEYESSRFQQIPVPSSPGGKEPPKITESHGKHGKQPGDAILATQKSFNKLQSMHRSTAILDAPFNPMAFEREAIEREATKREAIKRERQGYGNDRADAWQRQQKAQESTSPSDSWVSPTQLMDGDGAVDDSRGGLRRQQTMAKRPRYTEPGEVRQTKRSPSTSQEF